MTSSRPRRQPLTIMFCDMVGSTGLAQKQDVEAQAETVGRFHALCRDAITARGGLVAQYLGDGVLAYFGYPALREEEAINAVRAALAIRDALASPAGDVGTAPQGRIGIATGLVLVGDLDVAGVTQELAAIGPATNLAARLQGLAEPQGIVICAETLRLLRGWAQVAPLGPRALKGIDTPVEAFAVLRLAEDSRSVPAGHALVGRQVELAWLERLADEAASGRGCLAVIESEPGLGKSRLVKAFAEGAGMRGFSVQSLTGSDCFSDHPYWPLLQLLRADVAAADGIAGAQPRPGRSVPTTLVSAFRILQGGDATTLPNPGALPSAFIDWFLAGHTDRPLIALCEDIHWYDPSTLAWLDLLARGVQDRQVLVVCTTRPHDSAAARQLASAPSIRLAPLRQDEAESLLSACDPHAAIGVEARDRILAEAAGVPLFIEELAEAALNRPAAARHGGSAQPVSLSHGLLARIGTIDGADAICSALAVAGADVGVSTLAAACGIPARDAGAILGKLVQAGLVAERGAPPAYGFRHTLQRDAVYETILVEARGVLHGRVAEALAAAADADPAQLARHLSLAGQHAAAAGSWHAAGQRAVRGAAYREAGQHFHAALAAVAQLPLGEPRDRLELTVQSSLGLGLLGGEGYAGDAPIAALERARTLMQRLGELGSMSAVLTSLTAALFNRAEYRRSLDIREELLILAEVEGDPAGLCVAHRGVATIYNIFGQFDEAHRHAAMAWSHYDLRRDGPRVAQYPTDIGTAAAIQLAIALWHRGETGEARKMVKVGLAIASQLDHKNSLGYALTYALIVEGFLAADYARARDFSGRLTELGDRYGMPQWSIWGRCAGAVFDAHLGDPAAALDALKRGLSQREGLGGNRGLGALFHVGIGDALQRAGKTDAALAELSRAEAFASETGEVWMESLRLMIEARLHHGAGRTDRAASALAAAGRVAAAQGSLGMAGRVSALAAELGLAAGGAG